MRRLRQTQEEDYPDCTVSCGGVDPGTQAQALHLVTTQFLETDDCNVEELQWVSGNLGCVGLQEDCSKSAQRHLLSGMR